MGNEFLLWYAKLWKLLDLREGGLVGFVKQSTHIFILCLTPSELGDLWYNYQLRIFVHRTGETSITSTTLWAF